VKVVRRNLGERGSQRQSFEGHVEVNGFGQRKKFECQKKEKEPRARAHG